MEQLLNNRSLMAPIIAWWAAQLFKVLLNLLKEGRINLRFLTSSGGMPSAHSALVMALLTSVGKQRGVESAEFAITFVFASIVMYDATGVRRAVGVQARILNKMMTEMFEKPIVAGGRLFELVGHTPIQVVVGATMGIAIGLVWG